MPDFSVRSPEVEMMDDLDCSGPLIKQTLHELEVINAWLGGNAVTLNGVSALLKNFRPDRELVIADLGCGGGDMLKLVDQWAARKKIKVKLLGFDANPHIIDFARENTLGNPRIHFESLDIFSEQFRGYRFDVVIGTLFYHHFTTEQLIMFLQSLRQQTSCGIVINDIHRHPVAYYSIMVLTRWLSRSPMVKSDAPISVLRAFTKAELAHILEQAGYSKYTIHWKWAFRWQAVADLNSCGPLASSR